MDDAKLLGIVNQVLENAGKPRLAGLGQTLHLRNDLGFDSFHLAELTVKIEAASGVDIFEHGLVDTIADIKARLGGR